MKYNIRKNVFETNSSSVHTLCISAKGMQKPMGFRFDKNRKIYVPLQYFGKDCINYTTQKDKLSYLCTHLYVKNFSDKEQLYDSYEFSQLEEVIIKYFKKYGIECNGINVTKVHNAGIDWQSIDMFDSIWNFPIKIEDFVFNKNVYLNTDCD